MAKKKKQLEAMDKRMFKPTIRFTTKDLPELKNWKVGKEYEFTVKAKLIEMELPSEDMFEAEVFDKNEIKGKFEVKEITKQV